MRWAGGLAILMLWPAALCGQPAVGGAPPSTPPSSGSPSSGPPSPGAPFLDPSDQIPAGLIALIQRPEHRGELLAAAEVADKAMPKPCSSSTFSTTGEVGVFEPVRFDAAGKAVAGAWKEALKETGCGETRLLNALTVVKPSGLLATYPLLPGTTITDPELQKDSVQYAAAGMGQMPPGCEQGGVVNTEFVGIDGEAPGVRPKPGDAPKPWTERWTLQACSKRALVTMKFTPDATGTAIQASPAAP